MRKIKKTKVHIVNMGSSHFYILQNKLIKYKSNIIEIIFEKEYIDSDVFMLEDENKIINHNDILEHFNNLNIDNKTDIYILLTDYNTEANYGGCLTNDNKERIFYLSFSKTKDIIVEANISLVNFLLIAIYRDVFRYLCKYAIRHDESELCIFDTSKNEKIKLLSLSCNKPSICKNCKEIIMQKLNSNNLPVEYYNYLEKEIKKLKKELYYRILDLINENSKLTLIIVIFGPIILSILASVFYDIIKCLIKFLF